MNMRIFVSIFDDRLEIRSPGCLLPGMTIASIKEGVSMPRNLVIARIFQMLGWVEQFGTGYMRIMSACEAHEYPLPEWREVAPYMDIVFKPLVMEGIHDLFPRDQVGIKSAPSHEESKLLETCYIPMPIIELMIVLNWRDRTKFRRRFLIPLIEQGLLEMIIPDKPNSRLQKYVITQLGKQRVENK